MQSLVAWLVVPAVLLGLGFGLGQLAQRATRVPLAHGLLVPVGAALAVVLAFTGYVLGLRGILTPLLLAAIAAIGIVLWARDRPKPPRPGLAALVWVGAYGLYIAPVLLSGHWTWAGYDFVNDTSPQLLLAQWITEHSRSDLPPTFVTTTLDAVNGYLASGYPLGSHALLAAVHGLVPIPIEAVYQPFIAAFAGLGATALAVLARPLVGARWAAFAGFAAVTSSLLYQYAQQGNMKEVVTAALLATTAAVAGWTLTLLRESASARRGRLLIGAAVLIAIPFSAVVNVLSTAGAPYAAVIVLLWVVLLFAFRLVPGGRSFALALGAGAGALLAGTVLTFSTLVTFGKATSTTYATAARATDLGHLVRPLELRQTAGVWLIGDYRFPPIGTVGVFTSVGIWLIVALACVAVAWMLRRRQPGVLLFALPLVAIMLLVTPRVSPYADAKTYMLLAPGVTLLGALGAATLGRVRAALGVVLGALVLAGTLWSDALAYHSVHLAPISRMDSLRDLDRRFAGQGPILFNEPEEFAKNFMQHTRLNVGAEAVTPVQTQLRVPQAFAYLWFDVDDLTLDYVERFPLVAVRRSPVDSRPPSNFRLAYRNADYEVWRRAGGPRVLEHLPLQAVHQVSLKPRCADVRALARRARGGETLLASPAPDLVQLDTAQAARSPGWKPHPYRPDMVITATPGEAHATVRVRVPGTYRAWIAGSFGRPISGFVDGRRVGSAVGIDNVGQWHAIGTVDLSRGRHELRIERPSGGLAPGDGYAGELGPFALERVGARPLVHVAAAEARSRLCGHRWDWIERVRQ